MDVQLLKTLGRTWWLVLLRGVAAIVFGILAWTWPIATVITLVLFWGAYALVDGVAALVGGWQAKDSGKPMWAIVLVGVVGIAAGIFTFVQPGVTAIALPHADRRLGHRARRVRNRGRDPPAEGDPE